MKKLVQFALFITLAVGQLMAQAPQGFNYQAVVRNNSGQIIANKMVAVKISILQGSENGTPLYTYQDNVMTSPNGVVTVVMGEQNPNSYNAIDWANGPYFLKSEIDIYNNNPPNYTLETTQKILAVPYAHHAAVADRISSSFSISETDPLFTAWGYDYDSLINNPTALSQFINDLNFLTANDISLTRNGDTIFLTGGSYVILPPSGSVVVPGTISWDSIIGRPDSLSQFINNIDLHQNGDTIFFGDSYVVLDYSDAVTSIPWDSVIGHPENVSAFYNDLNYLTAGDISLTKHGDTIFLTGGSYVIVPTGSSIPVSGAIYWDSIIGRPTRLSQFQNDIRINWDSVTNHPTNLSQFNNDIRVNWDSITNHPTNLSQFNNDIRVNWDSITNHPTNLSQFNNDIRINWDSIIGRPDSLSQFVNNLDIHQNGDTLYFGDNYVVMDYSGAVTNIAWDSVIGHPDVNSMVAALNALIDSLMGVIDSLNNDLANSIGASDSLQQVLESLAHPQVPGILPGKFSIANGKQVQFSQGNLQYKPTLQLFRFALHQYDCSGVNNNNPSQFNSKWLDLFGYGTSGWQGGRNSWMPYDNSSINSNYLFTATGGNNLTDTNANGDWGIYNPVINGGNQMGLWRTLTNAEWTYLLTTRPNAAQKRALATVGSQRGLILLPDDWTAPSPSLDPTPGVNSYDNNQYEPTEWALLEAAGAVFLPAGGKRAADNVSLNNEIGYYWTTTNVNGTQSNAIVITEGNDPGPQLTNCSLGCSVRLVKDY